MSRIAHALIAIILTSIAIVSAPTLAQASPTGSPQIVQPLNPCRVLDTRASMGPLSAGTAKDVHVRGDDLPAFQGGRDDCGVPPTAEAVVVNVVALTPATGGHLKLNSPVQTSMGSYSRINYTAGENTSNEMIVNLCNVMEFPYPHQPCAGPLALGPDVYNDFQILNSAVAGSSVHVIVDVVGYLARMPLTTAVTGIVVSDTFVPGSPGVEPSREVLLDNGLIVVCQLPWAEDGECNSEVGDRLTTAGHVVNDDGTVYVFAHLDVGIVPAP